VPSARTIDGKAIARAIEERVAREVEELKTRGRFPHLVTIQVGQEPATELYIRNQKRRFRSIGIRYHHLNLDPETDQEGLLSQIRSFNANPNITGILVTLPMPPSIDPIRVQQEILPEKDVEAVGPFNLGNLIYNRGEMGPCSALAAMEAIRHAGARLEGARAVVVGHSSLVGKPMTLCLLRELATTTTCHIATRDLREETLRADILIVAVGKPGLITADMVKPGAVVIDVGINEVPIEGAAPGPLAERTTRIVGDVVFEDVAQRASWITPVPGGIGPITVALLARNTVWCAKEQWQGG
jgi:methylenetetrahydrofolate dehydrogenase (NADP+)/methenyltetrahydrofolate cyclohydrolase